MKTIKADAQYADLVDEFMDCPPYHTPDPKDIQGNAQRPICLEDLNEMILDIYGDKPRNRRKETNG
jgi:hypothetical protein